MKIVSYETKKQERNNKAVSHRYLQNFFRDAANLFEVCLLPLRVEQTQRVIATL